MTEKLNKLATKKVLGAIGVGLVLAGGFLGAVAFPQTKTVTVTENKIVEVPVNVEVEKLVDNGNLALVENYIYDNDGDLSELDVTDLDDDEVSLIADRIVFINEVKALAVNEVKAKLFDELDNEDNFLGVEFDDKDLSRLRVNDDADEVSVSDIDFENKDAIAEVTGTFEQDDIKYDFTVEVEFKDGEVEGLEVTDVVLH